MDVALTFGRAAQRSTLNAPRSTLNTSLLAHVSNHFTVHFVDALA